MGVKNNSTVILKDITDEFIEEMLKINHKDGGNEINKCLLKLFDDMNKKANQYEISVQVAALNTLYSTAIQNIKPVVLKIHEELIKSQLVSVESYVEFVDKISVVKYGDKSRNNLSFASKYVHFLSGYQTPIYDSYIWIIMIGYLKQKEGIESYLFKAPDNYKVFYDVFMSFKKAFKLEKLDNYKIDKFLWQYGKTLIDAIQIDAIQNENSNLSLEQAKAKLKKQIDNKDRCRKS
jgi:hypothetical protein